jgi:hypothetical protein
LLGLGLLFSAIGVVLLVRLRRFRRTAVRVPGVVADVVYDGSAGDSGSGGLWFPVLSFTTVEGRPVRTRGRYGRSPARARAGDQVTVLYDPEDPALASLPRDGANHLAVFFVVFGLGAAAVGALLLLLVAALSELR